MIGDNYLNKIWPDETCSLDALSTTLDNYFIRSKIRLEDDKAIFRIGGIGCGPEANVKVLRMCVDKLLKINPKLKIEIMLSDLSANELQLKHCLNKFPEKNVFIYSNIASMYDRCFHEDSMDIIFEYSCFPYNKDQWKPNSQYDSIFYIHGTNYNEECEKKSKDLFLEILTNVCKSLKKGGIIIINEFGTSDEKSEEIDKVSAFFTMMGKHLHKIVDKYDLKTTCLPLFMRNKQVMSEPIVNGQVSLELFDCNKFIDQDCHFKYLYRIADTDEKRKEIQTQMVNACTKPMITIEENKPEVVEKAWKEFLEIYVPECTDEKYLTGIPGTMVAAIKK